MKTISRWLNSLAFVLVIATMLACSALTGVSPQGPEAQIGNTLTLITATRDMVTVGVNAGKIKVADAENLRDQLNVARKGVDVAEPLLTSAPSDGVARLDAARAAIQAVKDYLMKKGVNP